ncbi:CGNR zinc finger domain-containing protein [Streptomyces sp. NPDC004065]
MPDRGPARAKPWCASDGCGHRDAVRRHRK